MKPDKTVGTDKSFEQELLLCLVRPTMNRWVIFVRPLRGLMMQTSFMNYPGWQAAQRVTTIHELARTGDEVTQNEGASIRVILFRFV
jgi:hypothetical protein